MSWEFTGNSLPDGRPIWRCPVCCRKIWGHNPSPHNCTGAVAPKAKKDDLPCSRRGDPQGKVNNATCNCKDVVYGCSKYGVCTINHVDSLFGQVQPQSCADCEDIDPPADNKNPASD